MSVPTSLRARVRLAPNTIPTLFTRSASRSSYAYHIPPYEPSSTQPPPIPDASALTSTPAHLTPEQRHVLESTIRVDQAGELGANYIYYGTSVALKLLGKRRAPDGVEDLTPAQVEEMWATERHHLKVLNSVQRQHRVRPTALWPVWKGMAFALGAGTALLGRKSIMACTEAVETVIGEHYDDQIKAIEAALPTTPTDPSSSNASAEPVHPSIPLLLSTLREFRDDELEHLDTAVENGAQMAPAHAFLSTVIGVGCKGAIWVCGKI